jgi:DNA-binding transcriptional MerR regulator
VHEFAQLAGVTVKTLYHYDRLGLLKPRRTDAGYRIYCERDLARLEQIVALKFLGLPLKQVRVLLDRDALRLPDALHMQRMVLEEKRRLLERAIDAIVKAEKIIESGQPAGAVLKEIIEAIEMQSQTENNIEFMKNYYREEGWVHFKARQRDWPSREWNRLFREIQTALSEDPASQAAQVLAARWRKIRVDDSGGDPKVHAGLLKAWRDRQYWPTAMQDQFSEFSLDEISDFIAGAFAAYRKAHYGEIVSARDLDVFSNEEKQCFPLASIDLYFKIEESLDEEAGGNAAQALAARWMELIECRTGGKILFKEPGRYESYFRWMEGWPPEIHQRIRRLNMERIEEFILQAIAHPMYVSNSR